MVKDDEFVAEARKLRIELLPLAGRRAAADCPQRSGPEPRADAEDQGDVSKLSLDSQILRERDELRLNRLLIPLVPRGPGTRSLPSVLGPWIPAFAGMSGDWFNGGANKIIPLYRTVMVITGDITGGLCGMCDQSPSTSCSVCEPGGSVTVVSVWPPPKCTCLASAAIGRLSSSSESLASMTR